MYAILRCCSIKTIALLLIFESIALLMRLFETSEEISKTIRLSGKTVVDLQKMMMDDKIPLKEYQKCPRVFDMFKHLKKCYINEDDVKVVIYPSNLSTPINSLTIGIGGDISAERKMKTRLDNIQFYGADPFYETSQVFKTIGKVYQNGVSKKSGSTNASVLIEGKYEWKEIKTITLERLLKKIRQPTIDYLLMDIEGAEYGILPNIHSASMEKYTICQINVEVHGPLKEYGVREHEFINMIHSLLSPTSPYILLWIPPHTLHHRFFLFNWKSAKCLRKFMKLWC